MPFLILIMEQKIKKISIYFKLRFYLKSFSLNKNNTILLENFIKEKHFKKSKIFPRYFHHIQAPIDFSNQAQHLVY